MPANTFWYRCTTGCRRRRILQIFQFEFLGSGFLIILFFCYSDCHSSLKKKKEKEKTITYIYIRKKKGARAKSSIRQLPGKQLNKQTNKTNVVMSVFGVEEENAKTWPIKEKKAKNKTRAFLLHDTSSLPKVFVS